MSGSELRLGLVGWGAIAQHVAELLQARGAPVRIVAVAVRDGATARTGLPEGAHLVTTPEDLMAAKPDLVLEAAGRATVLPFGRAALRGGADFAPCSTSAFADDPNDLAELCALARQAGRQILLPPGALGGLDALKAAATLPLKSVRHEVIKPAVAWRGTAAEGLCDLSALTAPYRFFEGTAAAAAAAYPQNANSVLTTALAGIGPDLTEVWLTADPAARLNRHEITAEGDFGRLNIVLENAPLPENPKSSALTALSLVRLVENRRAPLVI